jgi:hypothetical protein
MELQALEPLVGEWAIEVRLPGHDDVIRGRTSFAWLEGGGYLIQRLVMEHPQFPRGVMVIGPDRGGERIVQHYFDSRGVARVYDISLEDGVLRLSRDDADFAQRYAGHFSADALTIDGAWETCRDGATWEHDFEVAYTKLA